jgi:two-component system OmpR family response regulator
MQELLLVLNYQMTKVKHKILLAEDDESFGELLKNYLELHDFEVWWCKNGIEAFKIFHKNTFDICLLDVMMPDMNGFELAKEIKRNKADMPLLFLSAKSLKEDLLAGYQCGADDYITKPFDSELLIYKINAILKRTQLTKTDTENKPVVTFGKYTLDTNLRLLIGPNGEQKLSPKETELLKLLYLYIDNLLPRGLALKNIWGKDDYFTGRSMDVYVTKIRKYLKDDPSLEIINIHGKGYRFNIGAIRAV